MESPKKQSSVQLKTIFNPVVIRNLDQTIKGVFPQFDSDTFVQQASQNLDTLELKQRSHQICLALNSCLPDKFASAIAILLSAMGEDDGTGGIEGYAGFRFMPFLDYVVLRGMADPDLALESLVKMNLYFSAEFAIRPFILNYPAKTLPRLTAWASHPDWRVRRLASEGTRPRLPWGIQLKPFIENPSAVIDILNRLYQDENLVVRRSVANNLNDIAKDNPDVAVKMAQRWWRTQNELSQWTVRHGLRTLIKQGNQEALSILGFVGGERILVQNFCFQSLAVKIGEELHFSFSLLSAETSEVRLVVDYILHRRLANGKLATKVFKLKQIFLAPGAKISLQGKHKFKQLSTRTYYPGIHSIELIANGHLLDKYDFELTLA